MARRLNPETLPFDSPLRPAFPNRRDRYMRGKMFTVCLTGTNIATLIGCGFAAAAFAFWARLSVRDRMIRVRKVQGPTPLRQERAKCLGFGGNSNVFPRKKDGDARDTNLSLEC
jgi:hypothetical protein